MYLTPSFCNLEEAYDYNAYINSKEEFVPNFQEPEINILENVKPSCKDIQEHLKHCKSCCANKYQPIFYDILECILLFAILFILYNRV